MVEFKAGDEVMYGTAKCRVEHKKGAWLWLFGEGMSPSGGAVVHENSVMKIEPFFEAGKTYSNYNYSFRCDYVGVNGNGEPYAVGVESHLSDTTTGPRSWVESYDDMGEFEENA